DYAAKKGVQGITGSDGSVDLVLGASSMKLDRLYVYPLDANWSLVKKKVTIKTGDKVTLTPLDLGYQDGVRHFYGNAAVSVGAGGDPALVSGLRQGLGERVEFRDRQGDRHGRQGQVRSDQSERERGDARPDVEGSRRRRSDARQRVHRRRR